MESWVPRPSHPRWLLDELATAGRENLEPDHVARYDDKEDANATGELALLLEHGLDQRFEVVDLGAGTGQFTLAVAAVCARVVAVDVSPLMLARLRTKLAASGLSNVEVVQAGFLTYEHRGQPADIVYCRWALHHLPDFWKSVALRRMRDFVRDGGLLRLSDVVYSFEPSEAEERIEAWCATLPTAATGDSERIRADVEEHVRDEHSTYAWLLEPMMERSGFGSSALSTRPTASLPTTSLAPCDRPRPPQAPTILRRRAGSPAHSPYGLRGSVRCRSGAGAWAWDRFDWAWSNQTS